MDDIAITISQRVLQHALSAFAAEKFMLQRMILPQLGLTVIGDTLQLELGSGRATIHLTFHGAFQIKMGTWKLREKRETLTVHVNARFAVIQNALYMHIEEGALETRELAWLEKPVSEALRLLIRQLFQQPLLRLPLHLDVSANHAESTDESRLTLSSVEITPDSLQIAMRLEHDTVERLTGLVTAGMPVRSRSRAIMLCRRGIAERGSGNTSFAASLFYEAAVYADPPFETAWLWLAESVNTRAERRYCLERAVSIAPENSAAQHALASLVDVTAITPQAHVYRV